MPLKGAEVDDYVFHTWLGGSHASNAVVPPKIKALVSMGFTSLPIGISINAGYDGRGAATVQRSGESATENALFKAPSLAPLMRANGKSSPSDAAGLLNNLCLDKISLRRN